MTQQPGWGQPGYVPPPRPPSGLDHVKVAVRAHPLVWSGVATVLVAAFVLAAIFAPKSNTGREDAYVACQHFVSGELKAPLTATFPDPSEVAVTDTGGGQFTVVGYVDAENSFGAKVRSTFRCTVRHGSDGWRSDTVTVDGP